jgi:4-diphosphocytidyl-2-C-methyl-D-erythritol kinase
MSSAAHAFPAPAKLNLMLRVLGRRADGYHLLETVFRFLDYGDELRIGVRDDGVIRGVHTLPGVLSGDDLSLRAARLLKQATGTPLGADIELLKRLPLGAGLGGGSSDAATVLLALNKLWNTGLDRERLQALALTLGADVPVFVFGESAFAEGIGEMLTPIPLQPAWYVVLTPAVNVATTRVFAHPDLKRNSKTIKIQAFSVGGLAKHAVNDLEPLVCRLYPDVAHHLDWLKQHGTALMTGSGSAVFASFDTEALARGAMAQLPKTMSGFVARGLDRHPLRELGY